MKMQSVLIYLGGNGPSNFPASINREEVVKIIAADSGIELAHRHGVKTDVLVGDLDSATQESIELAEKNGAEIIRLNPYKDFTDFEIALIEASKLKPKQLIIIGGGGLRTDHLLANISVLCGEQTKDYFVDIYFVDEFLQVCRANQARTINSKVNTTVSLLPVNGDVEGVSTSGLEWKLNNAKLSASKALGISNILTKTNASVEVNKGTLLIIQQLQEC